jgi:hypothetical protein
MAEWSKALRSGRSPLLWAWVRIPLLTNFSEISSAILKQDGFCWQIVSRISCYSRVAQWKRAGPITQRSVDRNYALLISFYKKSPASVAILNIPSKIL